MIEKLKKSYMIKIFKTEICRFLIKEIQNPKFDKKKLDFQYYITAQKLIDVNFERCIEKIRKTHVF